MASILYSAFELHPNDVGYVRQVDHYDDGTQVVSMVSVGDNPASAAANYAALITKARAALQNNQAFLGLGSPTQAQAVAQVQALTRQVDALIYFLLHELTGLNSTPGV